MPCGWARDTLFKVRERTMDKRLSLKLMLILAATVLMAWSFYPPSQKLRQGLDLQGGTSLIYAIDTTGMSPEDQKDVAQRLVPILRKRIDPDNIQNLVIRPQGFGRIEIQMPLASKSVQDKRKAYDEAVDAVQKGNINIALIERAVSMPAEERAKELVRLAGGTEARMKIISAYVAASDKLKALRAQSDSMEAKLETAAKGLSKVGVDAEQLKQMSSEWSSLTGKALDDAILKLLPKDAANLAAIKAYLAEYKQWAAAVNSMTQPGTGANDAYRTARASLEQLNLNIDLVRQTILEKPADSAERNEKITKLGELFPERKAAIETLVKAFDDYRKVRGRLDDPEDLRRILKGVGVLEFRILPQTRGAKAMDPSEIALRTQNLDTYGPARASDEKYVWVPTESADTREWEAPDRAYITHKFGEKLYVLASNQPSEVLLQSAKEKAWQLERSYPSTDDLGRRAIGFSFNQQGANMFHRLTSSNIGRPLCILLDNQAISAPNIQSAIFSQGIITGEFTQTQVTDMVNKLNAGSLPARLIDPPITTKTIGPSIGAENRDAGIRAGIIGLVIVAGFMAVYYISSGIIADAALVLNLIFILAAMAFSGSTFTLPGIAGVILTLGMAVDANVLINERIREEQAKGCSIRVAVKNGYDRAFVVIFDSNLTTILSALILYIVASEEIKGFAITLMLGLISSMVTSIWVTRLIFEWLLQKRVFVDKIRMMHIFGKPNVNWMGLLPIFLTISGIVTIGGSILFFTRDDTKNSKYDIEFTGGTQVTISLKQPLTREQVEERIQKVGAEEKNPRLAAATVVAVVGQNNLQFDISTLETNKTDIDVTFPKAMPTEVEARKAITAVEDKFPAGTLTDMTLSPSGQTLKIETSQTNSALVKEIVATAFQDRQAVVGEPKVNEIVNNAIVRAFGDILNVNQDLGPKIVETQMIDNKLLDKEPQLSDYYGGAKLTFTLEMPATAAQIEKRFRDLQYKPGMANLAMNPYELLRPDLSAPGADEQLTKFVYVSRIPEAGYRDLTPDEISKFLDNEKTKIVQAASLRESLPRVTQIDPSIGSEAKLRAVVAVGLGWVMIIAYLWFRFGRARYGIAGVVALIHDVIVAVTAVVVATYVYKTPIGQALLIGDFKINLDIIAAFLTIIGYSINDTIVVFDRIRENRGKNGVLSAKLINDSINQTLSRTVLTSFATFLVLFAMYVWGGPGLRGFTYTMMVGVITGTFSSIAIASPILLIGSKGKEVQA
jgi:SecD/SecF fusion protein